MKYITKGEPNLGSLPYKVDLTDNVITILERTPAAGDYVLYDKTNQELVCASSSTDLSNYPIEKYTPIGIVVVPTSHDVYGDGSCAIVSLMEMSCNTPDEGKSGRPETYWGNYSTDTLLPNRLSVPIGDTLDGIPTGRYSWGYFPTDADNNTQCAHDANAYYPASADPDVRIPSPYLTDGSRNPGYYQTTAPLSTNNVLADFSGVENTIILQNSATAQSDWKTADTIINESGSGYAPAACCCWRYHTEGTQQGDWYLPAAGEVGYLWSRSNKIEQSIYNLQDIYGYSIAGQSFSGSQGSSTEYNSIQFWYITQGPFSTVNTNVKTNAGNNRAFLRAGGTSKISLKII